MVKFSLDSLVTNRDKKFCDADTLTEEMKELLIEKTLEAIDKVYAILEAVEPCGEDNRRELWLKAERGTIDDYDDYESLKDEEVVENYEEFEKMWHEEYPDEISWYHLVTIERDDYRAIFLGRELIYQPGFWKLTLHMSTMLKNYLYGCRMQLRNVLLK